MESLATKYRPQTFEDVVGQENIIKILNNQISNNAIKQGYLFTGGAGTGKTTIARIFAKQINGSHNGIIEIDAASNNGVDNVREIRENVKFKPIGAKYKIYIIDEVHMLSIGAFNALLKTLEEPPAHAIFILATTDPQKIPATILSRVQRFDFKRMTVEQTIDRLNYIIQQEQKLITPEAVEYIAKLAQGGMRAAISILDTILSYGDNINIDDVMNLLGASSHDDYLKLASFIAQRDFGSMIELIEDLHIRGKDLKLFILGFAEFIVDSMKFDLIGNFDYTNIPTIYHERVQRFIKFTNENKINLIKWFEKLNQLHLDIKYESNPKPLIQGGLMLI